MSLIVENHMSKRLTEAGLLLLITISYGDVSLACGDKFLVTSRASRFQRAAIARQPASILIYSNPASELPRVLAGIPVDATLTKAGYRPTTAATTDELEKALSRGGWDLVLVALADARPVSKRLQGDRVPVVLPVLVNPTTSELDEARKLYPVVLKAPAKSQSFLSAIDEALARRPKPPARPAGKG
jgi:hypothetical protein